MVAFTETYQMWFDCILAGNDVQRRAHWMLSQGAFSFWVRLVSRIEKTPAQSRRQKLGKIKTKTLKTSTRPSNISQTNSSFAP